MNEETIVVILIGVIVALVMVCIGMEVYHVTSKQKVLDRIQRMLDGAIAGTFKEEHLDESKLSAIENSLWRYLCDSEVSYMNVSDEKTHIQALISDISHQTVTPIANIMLYSQLMEEQLIEGAVEQDAEIVEEIVSIREQAEKLDFLIQSLVKLSRLEAGIITVQAKKQSIRPVLVAIEKQFRAKAEQKEITFQVALSDEIAVYDLKWVSEAIGNIVDNAIKYTPNGGTIVIRVASYSLFLRMDISDNGIGVAESEQGHIFTRFYRSLAVKEKPGVGIGLYLAREVLRAQDGYVKMESTLGQGSKFSVFLSCKATTCPIGGESHKSETVEKLV